MFLMKLFTSKTQKIGELGEDLACMFLMKQGFSIIERNYTRKCGEIDIIVKKNGITHFIEVKSLICENNIPVTHVTYNPEENLHSRKLKRIHRTVQLYILENNMDDKDWRFDLLAVFIDMKTKTAKFRKTEDLIL